MAYQIKFDEKGKADFKQLDNSIKLKIKKYFKKLEKVENPKAFGEPLKENLAGYWKYRVGNYRVVAEMKDNELIILVIAVGHRSIIYKKVDKRFNK